MDRNLLLAFALSFAVLMAWSMLQGDPRPVVPPGGSTIGTEAPTGETAPDSAPPIGLPPAPAVPLPEVRDVAESLVPEEKGETVAFETSLYRTELSTLGGVIQHWELREYDEGPRGDYHPIVLTTGGATGATPFEELGLGDLSLAAFTLRREGTSDFVFALERGGVTLRKSYSFEEGSYRFRVRIDVENRSASPVAPRFALRWSARHREGQDYTEQSLVAYHDGSVEQQPVQGLGRAGFLGSLTGARAEMVIDYPGDIDWAGLQTTYFLSAVFPDKPTEASALFVATEPGEAGSAEVFFPPVEIPPGRSATREYRGYIGPKEIDRLEQLGSGAAHAIDVGWSWFAPMTSFFAWLLKALHEVVPNYGLAIIILTVMVRVVTAPLTTRQMRSMERMRELQPKLKAIQEKHKDDRQKQSEETMRMYRSEGVNPLGGCLPMLLQLPVMIGLFYALRSSIQLRHAPFFGWIDDLSAPETLFTLPGIDVPVRVLPLIMGATMVLQQRMTPMNIDPTQARMMATVMPIMMTVLFYQFASGLVLYWMVGNVLAIAHQMWIRHQRAAKE